MEIVIAGPEHIHFAKTISLTIEESAKDRGTGIARRTPEYIIQKMQNGNAVIAFEADQFAGFCYIEIWGHGKYVAHSGLIVAPAFRGQGLAKKIKKQVFNLSLEKFPGAKIFGITTGQAVMKINYDLAKPAKTLMSFLEQNANSVCALVCYMIQMKKNKPNLKPPAF